MECHLFESLVHHLIEKGVLTKNDALSVVQTVAEVKRGELEEERFPAAEIECELGALQTLYSSFELMADRPSVSRPIGSGNVVQLRTPRQRANPGPGLIGQIIREHGDEINDFDLAGLADGVFTGGLETTASMLALGTAVLLDHPDTYALLPHDADLAERTVEELLRYLSVVQVAFPRFPKHDVEVAGHRFAKGDVVICHLAGANRDERTVADGDVFQPVREPRSHLAFGHGFHRCVGAALARLELGIAYPALARRFPHLAVEADALDYRPMSIVYGVESLPVRLEPATSTSTATATSTGP